MIHIDKNSDVTFVLTSCNRYDLLDITLSSFIRMNTYPIKEFIVIEDGSYNPNLGILMSKYPEITWIINGQRIGQIKCVDRAYSMVNTDYIFHCEDDWEFYRPGFIETSREYLRTNSGVIQLWLRERNDTNGHPIVPNTDLLSLNYENGAWNGFSFNPGLKRICDYRLIGSYGSVLNSEEFSGQSGESNISCFYRDNGFRAAIAENGYVRHIGWGRRVQN